MKKFNTIDSKHIFSWLICCLLVFAASFTGTFAYFTATTAERIGTAETAQVKIGFSGNPQVQVNSEASVNLYSGFSGKTILPGDVLHLSATIQNIGNVPIYAIAEMRVYISASTIDENTVPVFTYYTTCGGTDLTYEDDMYKTGANVISANGTVNFTRDFTFTGNSYGNTYKSNNIKISLFLHSVQYANIDAVSESNVTCTAAVNATNIMLLGDDWVDSYVAPVGD